MAVAEKWKVVPGYPHYLVSDQGNVDALIAFVPTSGARGARRMIVGVEARHRIKAFESYGRKRHATNYQRVYLWRLTADGTRSKDQPFVHRLVLSAFVGPCPDGHEASHLNGQRDDNRLLNLRWETGAENHRRRLAHKTSLHGERHFAATLTDAQALECRRLVKQGVMQVALASRYGVGRDVIHRIVRHRTWAHLP